MIAINLLRRSLADARYLRRRRRWEGMIGFLALGLVCFVIGLAWVNANHRIRLLQPELAAKRAHVATQGRFQSDVKILVELRERLTQRLLRLKEIQRLRDQPLDILDTVSQSLDPLDLWLVTMQLENGRLALKGLAGSREDILKFSKNLDNQVLFREVTISETRAEVMAEGALYAFSIDLKIDMEHVGSVPS